MALFFFGIFLLADDNKTVIVQALAASLVIDCFSKIETDVNIMNKGYNEQLIASNLDLILITGFVQMMKS